MQKDSPKIGAYLKTLKVWQEETTHLHNIVRECQLQESLKWGKPCYTYDGKNVVIIQGFKNYCALMFFKGVLLKDPKGKLIPVGSNSQSAKQLRFTNSAEIKKQKALIKTYIKEAIAIEQAGLKVKKKSTSDYSKPAELTNKLNKDKSFRNAFNALTPGRQRGYILHFSQPKQSKTRLARIEKCLPLILAGKGYNEDYKSKK